MIGEHFEVFYETRDGAALLSPHCILQSTVRAVPENHNNNIMWDRNPDVRDNEIENEQEKLILQPHGGMDDCRIITYYPKQQQKTFDTHYEQEKHIAY